jgi:hypothetical protein
VRLSWATFASSQDFSVEISDRLRNLIYARQGKRNATDVFRAEVDFDKCSTAVAPITSNTARSESQAFCFKSTDGIRSFFWTVSPR